MIEISDYMNTKLKNWARWCLSGKSQGHCMSLEHRYLAESDLSNLPTNNLEINILDASKVEDCISLPDFPKKYRRLIINEYVWRKQYQRSCRELGIRYLQYDYELDKAVIILDKRLSKNIDREYLSEYSIV